MRLHWRSACMVMCTRVSSHSFPVMVQSHAHIHTHTCILYVSIHTHTFTYACRHTYARVREPRPRRQVPFTHTLARKQIPSLSRIYWNNLGKYDKFGYEICRRACELSAPVSLPLCLNLTLPPQSISYPFASTVNLKPDVAPLPLRPPGSSSSSSATRTTVTIPASRISPTRLEWYLLKIGSIATWVFACSSYMFRHTLPSPASPSPLVVYSMYADA